VLSLFLDSQLFFSLAGGGGGQHRLGNLLHVAASVVGRPDAQLAVLQRRRRVRNLHSHVVALVGARGDLTRVASQSRPTRRAGAARSVFAAHCRRAAAHAQTFGQRRHALHHRHRRALIAARTRQHRRARRARQHAHHLQRAVHFASAERLARHAHRARLRACRTGRRRHAIRQLHKRRVVVDRDGRSRRHRPRKVHLSRKGVANLHIVRASRQRKASRLSALRVGVSSRVAARWGQRKLDSARTLAVAAREQLGSAAQVAAVARQQRVAVLTIVRRHHPRHRHLGHFRQASHRHIVQTARHQRSNLRLHVVKRRQSLHARRLSSAAHHRPSARRDARVATQRLRSRVRERRRLKLCAARHRRSSRVGRIKVGRAQTAKVGRARQRNRARAAHHHRPCAGRATTAVRHGQHVRASANSIQVLRGRSVAPRKRVRSSSSRHKSRDGTRVSRARAVGDTSDLIF
jgi:hypothetical protein